MVTFVLLDPQFVGSFDIGDYVYFFFREFAVENINCGKAVYSRVARLCKVRFWFLAFRFEKFLFYRVTSVAKMSWSKLGRHSWRSDSTARCQENSRFTSMKSVSSFLEISWIGIKIPFPFAEDVFKIANGDDALFYATFTTSLHGFYGSAVCVFSLRDINAAFDRGTFKEQASSTSAWLPVIPSQVPHPRPGQVGFLKVF